MTKKNCVVLFLIAVAFSASVEAQELIDNLMISACSELTYIFPDGNITDDPESIRIVGWDYNPNARNGMLNVLFRNGPIEGAEFFFQDCRTVNHRDGVIRTSQRVSYRVRYRNEESITTINRSAYGSIGFENSVNGLNVYIRVHDRVGGTRFADIKLLGLEF